MPKIIIFLGPPGSGKGTQANIASKKIGVPFISTGSLIRKEIKTETSIGKEIKEGIANGEFVSDEIVRNLLHKRLKLKDTQNGFILDGYPRNLKQAIFLDEKIKDGNIVVVYVKVSNKEVKHRILGRRVCSKCGANYHIKYKKPKVKNICDICGGELIIRSDDNKKSIEKRLDIYYKVTQPLINFYKKTNRLIEIDGEKSIDEIAESISEKIVKKS